MTAAGYSARAVRLSFVGELGWELHVPNSSAEKVYEAIWQAGTKHGLVNAGYRAIDSLSIEKGSAIMLLCDYATFQISALSIAFCPSVRLSVRPSVRHRNVNTSVTIT